jgi:competence protein ComEC
MFVISLYLLSIKAYILLMFVLCLFILPMKRQHGFLTAILIMAPVLAFLSLRLYYAPKIPEDIRVTHVYSGSVVGKDGFRRYQFSGTDLNCRVGDIIQGDFQLEPLPWSVNGYVGKLSASEFLVGKDMLSSYRQLKGKLIRRAVEIYGHDRGGLMASLVLGSQDEINEKRVRDMRSMGIMHILSISGFHFALLENALKKLGLGRWRILILGGYALFIDSIPGYRTILSAVYRTAGYLLRRDQDVITGLFLAMFIQVFLCPYYIFKAGFLLTYLSTLGILIFHKRLERIMAWFPSAVSGSLSLTMAALSLSLPVILSFNPEFSLGVFLGNMILVPLYSIVTYLSFLSILIMDIPFLVRLLMPFLEIFFDLAAHLGSFMSSYALALNLEMLVFSYVPLAGLLYAFFRRKAFARGLMVTAMILLLTLPWGNAIKIYNKFGHPYIRITHNFMNYDIMDYRISEEGYLPVRTDKRFVMAGRLILVRNAEKERQVPHVFIDGKELLLERDLQYHGGVTMTRGYIFTRERIIRVK